MHDSQTFWNENRGVRSSSVLSFVCGVFGWFPLGVSLLAALFGSGERAVGVFLGGSAAVGVVGLALGLNGVRGDRSSSGGVLALLGITLSLMLLGAGTVWGLLEFAR